MNDQQQQKQNDAFWTACIRAFLHDPPDKALDVKRHEERARIYLSAALNIPPAEVRDEDLKAADWLASAIERLPLPKGTLRDCDGNALDPVLEQPFNRIPRDQLRRCSPINGGDLTNEAAGLREAQDLSETVIERRAERIRLIAQANPEARLRAYALWRLLPPALPRVSQLPGDTRLTDHSIVDHADAAMAACAALQGERRVSLLVFSIGPVQDFIVKGRSLRDLWTGSYFLSWLTFHAMGPILKDLGPWCITSPGLRGNPLCDRWLGEEGVRIPPDDELRKVLENEGVRWKQGGNKEEEGRLSAPLAALRCASLPNTFTALIPTACAPELAAQVREACETAWWTLCDAVEGKLHACWQQLSDNDWRTGWKQQCASVWDIRCVTLPLVEVDAREKHSITASAKNMQKLYTDLCGELPEGVRAASEIARALQQQGWAPPYVTPEGQGLWMLANELAQRLLEADKRARRVPPHADTHDTREKCALFPGFSVMGPVGDTRANKDWWNNVIENQPDMPGLLRPSERLSAPGLVKRFAYGAYFEHWFAKATAGVSASARTSHLSDFPDTREVAFGFWIKLFRGKFPNETSPWENWCNTVEEINHRAEERRNE
ncbi:MAG: hypothetical protein N2688_08400, partial [Burkholderiaceae bacterium]|nr:hypothetical protein [Burkholderiaceae bacterium]